MTLFLRRLLGSAALSSWHLTKRACRIRFHIACALGLSGVLLTGILDCNGRGELPGSDKIAAADKKVWRNAEHDAINALYVFLKLYGVATSYDDILEAAASRQPPKSVREIKSIAEALHFPLAIRRIKPEDLMRIPMPALTFMEGNSPETGRFALLLEVRKNEVMMMDGNSAVVTVRDREAFFRWWNGVVVIPESKTRLSPVLVGIVGFILGIIMARCLTGMKNYFVFASALGLFLSASTDLFGADQPVVSKDRAVAIPEDCVSSLQKTEKLIQGCKVESESAHEHSPEFMEKGRPISEQFQSIFSRGYCYHHREVTTTERFVIDFAFDGKVLYYGGIAAAGNSFLTKYLGDNPSDDLSKTIEVHDPYLTLAGFVCPLTIGDWVGSSGLRSFVLKAIDEGTLLSVTPTAVEILLELEIPEPAVLRAQKVDLDELAGRSYVTSTPIDRNAEVEYYKTLRSRKPFRRTTVLLDREKGYAIKNREDRTLDGEIIFKTECHDFQQVDQSGLWLPRTVITRSYVSNPETLYGFGSSPKTTVTYGLKQFSFDVPADATYAIDYGPGCYVSDRSLAESKQAPLGAITYQVPNPNQKLRKAAAEKRSGKASQWNLLFVVNAGVFIVLITALIRKSRRKQQLK